MVIILILVLKSNLPFIHYYHNNNHHHLHMTKTKKAVRVIFFHIFYKRVICVRYITLFLDDLS